MHCKGVRSPRKIEACSSVKGRSDKKYISEQYYTTLQGPSKSVFSGNILKMETVPIRGFCSPYLEFLLPSGVLINFL
jgi:hypothetical protein